jgi:hypothetical protein
VDQQLAEWGRRLDLVTVLVGANLILDILVIVFVGFVAAWAVKSVLTEQQTRLASLEAQQRERLDRLEHNWQEVLGIIAATMRRQRELPPREQ